MNHILQINSSLNGPEGQSTKLADRLVTRLRMRHPTATLTTRDLSRDPVPHLDAATFAAFGTPAEQRTPEQRQQAALSDTLIAELRAADALVLTAPMYNFGLPSSLKAWFDHVARAGETYRYTEQGPQGLLAGREAYVVSARGGRYRGTPKDSQTTHLRTLLDFFGYDRIEFVYAEGLAMGDDARKQALQSADAESRRLAA